MNEIFDKALAFASKAHSRALRKDGNTPYIIHPLEVSTIVATMTDDVEVMAAALLHDTVEDAGVTLAELETEFGHRIASLVASETEDKREGIPPEQSWTVRKEESLSLLRNTDDIAVKILWLADKLSNMRSFYRQYLKKGDALWQSFNQKDPNRQRWYYKTVAELTADLCTHPAWQEYNHLLTEVFR